MDGTKFFGARAAAIIRRQAPTRDAPAPVAWIPDQWCQSRPACGELAARTDEQRSDLGPSHPNSKWTDPIFTVGSTERQRIVEHLLALDVADRYWRFAYAASDEHIRRYVAGMDFGRDGVFGIFDRSREMLAMAHLARLGVDDCERCAEFGFSVAKSMRGGGLGSRLLQHAITYARCRGVQKVVMRILSENRPALAIARHAGATVRARGAESEAWLTLPATTANGRSNGWIAGVMATPAHGSNGGPCVCKP